MDTTKLQSLIAAGQVQSGAVLTSNGQPDIITDGIDGFTGQDASHAMQIARGAVSALM